MTSFTQMAKHHEMHHREDIFLHLSVAGRSGDKVHAWGGKEGFSEVVMLVKKIIGVMIKVLNLKLLR